MPFNDNLPAENTDPWYTPLVTAWNNLKTFVNGLETAIGGKADLVHTHTAADVTSGTFTTTRIPDLNASKIASGTLDIARIPTAELATAAQGALADTAVQPAAIANFVPNTRTVAGKALSANVALVKGDVGLGNVDNTSDANKPVSIAQQAALDAKVPTSRTVAGYALTADVPRAGLNTRGVGEALFIPSGGTVPGGTPTYTIIIEAS